MSSPTIAQTGLPGSAESRLGRALPYPDQAVAALARPAANACPWCRGSGRRSSADVTVGFTWTCPDCAGTGVQGEGYATAAELVALHDAARAADLDAAALKALCREQCGEVPGRLREWHVAALLARLAERQQRYGHEEAPQP